MGYLDYPFPDGDRSYINHREVQGYLEKFAKDFQLSKYIQVRTIFDESSMIMLQRF